MGEMLRGERCSGSQLRNASWLRRRWHDALSRSASWYGRSNDVPTELSLPTEEGELETRSLEELSFTDAAARSRQVNLLPPSGYVL